LRYIFGPHSEIQGAEARIREVSRRNNCFNFIKCKTGQIVDGSCNPEKDWEDWKDCNDLKAELNKESDGVYTPPDNKWWKVWSFIENNCNDVDSCFAYMCW